MAELLAERASREADMAKVTAASDQLLERMEMLAAENGGWVCVRSCTMVAMLQYRQQVIRQAM